MDFANNFEPWLKKATLPKTIKESKLYCARALSSLLKRRISFEHLLHTVQELLVNKEHVKAMHQALCRFVVACIFAI